MFGNRKLNLVCAFLINASAGFPQITDVAYPKIKNRLLGGIAALLFGSARKISTI